MYSLFIDTHNQFVNIVLFKDGKILTKKEEHSINSHSTLTIPLVEIALKEHKLDTKDLDKIIVVNGPGSFTGVRIGVTVAKTLAYSLNIPIQTISSLKAKAISANISDNKIVSILEKNGAYIGEFCKYNRKNKDYYYLNSKEYEKLKKEREVLEDILWDYERIYNHLENSPTKNVHSVSPIYIKNIKLVNGS